MLRKQLPLKRSNDTWEGIAGKAWREVKAWIIDVRGATPGIESNGFALNERK
jgi:hypothetical protein